MAQIIRSFFLVYDLAIPFAVQFSCMLTWLWEGGRGSQSVKVDKPAPVNATGEPADVTGVKVRRKDANIVEQKMIFMHPILKNI